MPRRPRPMDRDHQTIELCELLQGQPTWEQVADFFHYGEFDNEEYLVAAIKRHLLRPEHKVAMERHGRGFSIEDMLNGRVVEGWAEGDEVMEIQGTKFPNWDGEQRALARDWIFEQWNKALGFHCFGDRPVTRPDAAEVLADAEEFVKVRKAAGWGKEEFAAALKKMMEATSGE